VLSASDGDVQAAYFLGANGYLVKPTKFDDMLAMALDQGILAHRQPRAQSGPR
jgi:DNA-binding NarL/FixJ family response regulator